MTAVEEANSVVLGDQEAGLSGDVINEELLRNLQEQIVNGDDIQVLPCGDIPWSLVGDDNYPGNVVLEVEVISSWQDETDNRTLLDLDEQDSAALMELGERDSAALMELDQRDSEALISLDENETRTLLDLDELARATQIPQVTSTVESSSDYGSETEHPSEMDLSQSESLDLSKTGNYTEPPATAFTIGQFNQLQYPVHSNGCLDLSKTGALSLNGSRYHLSGGNAVQLKAPEVEHSALLDLSKTGQFFQMPRIKLEPGLGIDPTITYKPEMDYNHNEAVTSSLVVNKPEPFTFETKMEYKHEIPDTVESAPRVKVEHMEQTYPSPCQIPLTVTQPDEDDDNDSGTESIDSKDSDLSKSNSGSNKRRPGRKKGQVSKVYHLWEFIRDVLADPRYCPSVIKWENEDEGIFRVIQSEQAATMWGQKKNNRTKMTYEKMSRSIRYSRKEGYFADIPKDKGYPKKLCFKFGRKAHGWTSKMKTCAS